MNVLDKTFIFNLNFGFWIIAVPIAAFIISVEYDDWKRENIKNKIRESYLPNEKIYLDLSEQESLMLENLALMNKCTCEKYLKDKLKESEVSFHG